jgi:hypothetical protein
MKAMGVHAAEEKGGMRMCSVGASRHIFASGSGAVLVLCGLSACTYGEVTDAASKAPVQGATLVFESLDISQPEVSAPTQAVLNSDVTLRTWTDAELTATASPTAYAGWYWDDPYSTLGSVSAGVASGWVRSQLTAPGYDPVFVYRDNAFAVGEVATNVSPTSASNLAEPGTPNLTATPNNDTFALVSSQLFSMYESPLIIAPPICFLGICTAQVVLNDHPALPDLIVDVRSLMPTSAGASTPSPQQVAVGNAPMGVTEGYPCDVSAPAGTLPASTTECLAFPINIANVGTGNFELLSNTASLNSVQQVYYSATRVQSTVQTTGSMVATPPGGYHVSNLVQMRLRGPIVSGCLSATPAPGCCDTDATATTCSIVSTASKAFCMEGDTVFDSEIASQFGSNRKAAKLDGANIDSCQAYTAASGGGFTITQGPGFIDQGLTPGTSEMYIIGNPYNYLDITGLAPGPYWLEAEVNPVDPTTDQRVYMESDTTNNVARAQITITSQTGGGVPP